MRNQRIDAFRVYAMAMVVLVHAQDNCGLAAEARWERGLSFASSVAMRFAMPFFFVTAGFFLGPKIGGGRPLDLSVASGYSKRLLGPFLFWCGFYAVEKPILANPGVLLSGLAGVRESIALVAHHLGALASDPLVLFFEGTRFHLWFLVSLVLVVWLFVATRLCRGTEVAFLSFGAILFVVGLLGGAYRTTGVGLSLHFDTRDGPFFGTLFFGIGLLLSKYRWVPSLRFSAALSVAGVILSLAEIYALHRRYGIAYLDLKDMDYFAGTIPFGLGVTLAALAPVETRVDRAVGPWGRDTFGIYLSHVAFIDVLRPLRFLVPGPAIWVFFPPLVFAVSLAFTRLVMRTRLRVLVGG